MPNSKSVHDHCLENGIDHAELAEKAGLEDQRTLAIVMGRWTPSPKERDAIAAALGVAPDEIVWGHKTPIQHIYGSGPA